MSYIGNTPFTAAFLTDTFSGDGSDTTFTLSAAPANTSSIIVAVTGVLQDPSTYSVSGTTLTFSAAPPSGTDNISVRFLGIPASGVTTTAYRTVTEFTATAGQTTFSVPSYTVGYVDVYRNGVMLGTADFTASSGTTIVLASGATAGDLIRVESFYVSSVLNAIQATAGAVNTSYITDGAITQAKLASGVAGNGPAFSAYMSANMSISDSTFTKITADTENFDTASVYDTSTGRFTPNVAGYYSIGGRAQIFMSATQGEFFLDVYKNGSTFQRLVGIPCVANCYANPASSILVYLNGTTDYVELYGYQSSGVSRTISGNVNQLTYFYGFLVRAA
jgi:hypothetical protein